jgi:hypothetical protein
LCLLPPSFYYLAWFIIPRLWERKPYVPPKRPLTFNEIHGVVSHFLSILRLKVTIRIEYWIMCQSVIPVDHKVRPIFWGIRYPNLTWWKKKGKVVPVLNFIKHYAMKAYGGVDV